MMIPQSRMAITRIHMFRSYMRAKPIYCKARDPCANRRNDLYMFSKRCLLCLSRAVHVYTTLRRGQAHWNLATSTYAKRKVCYTHANAT